VTTVDLDLALADLERPKASLLTVGREHPLKALYHRPGLHRRVPFPLAWSAAYLQAVGAGWLPRARRRWRARAALALGAPAGSPAANRLARRLRVQKGLLAELTWHPERAARMPVDGLEHLEAARAAGKGTLIATIHLGPLLALVHALAARGLKLYVVGGHRLWEPPANQSIVFMNRMVEEAGARWVHVGGAFPVVRALLERGETCVILFDIPGGFQTRLGGQPAMVSDAFADLAVQTGAAVVPAYAVHRRGRMSGHLMAPMTPVEDEGAEPFAHRVVGAFDDVIAHHLDQAQLRLTDAWQAAAPHA
jgi:lauroyl/myristoyl acyltransferase